MINPALVQGMLRDPMQMVRVKRELQCRAMQLMAGAYSPNGRLLDQSGDAAVARFTRDNAHTFDLDRDASYALPVLDDTSGNVLVPSVGGVFAVVPDRSGALRLYGADASRRRILHSGPHASLDVAIGAAVPPHWPPGRCDRCSGPRCTPAGLLPVVIPPHIVINAVCDGCYSALDAGWPDLYWLFPIPDTPEAIA